MNKPTYKTMTSLSFLALVLAAAPSVIGQEILYHSTIAGSMDIWTCRGDGTGKVNLSAVEIDPASQFFEEDEKWSPDGTKIAFTSYRSGTPTIWIMAADGHGAYPLTSSGLAETEPCWSPDGMKIYFVRNVMYGGWPTNCDACKYFEIFVRDLGTGVETRLTNNLYREATPIVSPDGLSVVYAKGEQAPDCCNATDVWIMDANGSNQRFLVGTTNGVYQWAYDWDAVSGHILYSDDVGPWPYRGEAFVTDAAGSFTERLTYDAFYTAPKAFSPDGTRILVTTNEGGSFNVAIFDIATMTNTLLTDEPGEEWASDWRAAEGPKILSITANPDVLWPPDHKMAAVTISIEAVSEFNSPVVSRIIGISSDESIEGLGDGDTAPDWEITGALSAYLRAERSGTGKGRTYTIVVKCQDAFGNVTQGSVSVFVPHNQIK
jgi:Tol biopolymer transport system component